MSPTKSAEPIWRKLVLTREEIRAICFVLLLLVVGVGTKRYRHEHPRAAPEVATAHVPAKPHETRKTDQIEPPSAAPDDDDSD